MTEDSQAPAGHSHDDPAPDPARWRALIVCLLAGATVLRGIEGFGKSSHIHTTRILSLSEDLPVVVVIVDVEARVRPFLAELEELVTEGLVTVEPVEVVHHAGREAAE